MAKLRKEKDDFTGIKQAIIDAPEKVVRIDSIKKWDKNPKNPKKFKAAVKRLAKIFKAHGQVTPIVVYTKDNMIRKGNTTLEAMKLNKAKKILVKFVNFPSRAAANAYAVADNESGTWNTMDGDLLGQLMRTEELGTDEQVVQAMTGLSEKDMRSLMLSSELPDELPDVDIEGEVDGKSDFVVVQFSDKKQMQSFKKKLGIGVEHQRVIPYDTLLEKMKWR